VPNSFEGILPLCKIYYLKYFEIFNKYRVISSLLHNVTDHKLYATISSAPVKWNYFLTLYDTSNSWQSISIIFKHQQRLDFQTETWVFPALFLTCFTIIIHCHQLYIMHNIQNNTTQHKKVWIFKPWLKSFLLFSQYVSWLWFIFINCMKYKIHKHITGIQVCRPTCHSYKKLTYSLTTTPILIQASLVIRDLTLRVFTITRFREKKPWENCTVILQSPWWWRDCVARAPAGHILPVSVWEGVLS
jgi:hypothetical protein